MNNDHPQTKELEYNYITDGIYVGTNQCCQAHFDENLLHKEGVTTDISLEEGRLDQPFGVEWYVWLPVKDHTPPSPAQLAFGVKAFQEIVALGKKVYVHCKNGHGRAPTLVAAYLIQKGMTPEAAEEFLQSKRPTVHINESQREALQKFVSRT